jgi:hypothetical protein
MPTPSKRQIARQITAENRLQLWIRWQALRRNPEYWAAVETFSYAVRTVVMKWTRPCAERLRRATMSSRLGNPLSHRRRVQ